jgi:cysteine desulfurase
VKIIRILKNKIYSKKFEGFIVNIGSDKMEVYFDNSATTKPYEVVIDAVVDIMRNNYGNTSSAHKLGMIAEQKLNKSREKIAKTLNCSKDEIIFTSGGTEANNFCIRGFLREEAHIITNEIEHPSVLKTFQHLEKEGYKVTYLKVNEKGLINLSELEDSICDNTVLLSIMHVNNEIGAVQNIEEIGKILKSKSKKAKFHVDAVQSYGKLNIDVKKLNIDMISVSGHKIHGPKGIGFAYVRKGLVPKPFFIGGSHERNLRAGTVNLSGVVGLAIASEKINSSIVDNYNRVLQLNKYFVDKLSCFEHIKINSDISKEFSPYILSVSFIGIRGEVLIHLLEEKNIFVSTGSACSSKNKNISHVLKSIGLDLKEIEGTIRFSFNSENTKEEVDYVVEVLQDSLKFLRRV